MGGGGEVLLCMGRRGATGLDCTAPPQQLSSPRSPLDHLPVGAGAGVHTALPLPQELGVEHVRRVERRARLGDEHKPLVARVAQRGRQQAPLRLGLLGGARERGQARAVSVQMPGRRGGHAGPLTQGGPAGHRAGQYAPRCTAPTPQTRADRSGSPRTGRLRRRGGVEGQEEEAGEGGIGGPAARRRRQGACRRTLGKWLKRGSSKRLKQGLKQASRAPSKRAPSLLRKW